MQLNVYFLLLLSNYVLTNNKQNVIIIVSKATTGCLRKEVNTLWKQGKGTIPGFSGNGKL